MTVQEIVTYLTLLFAFLRLYRSITIKNLLICIIGKVLNDHADGFSCIDVANCPCVLAGRSYSAGDTSSTKCQSW